MLEEWSGRDEQIKESDLKERDACGVERSLSKVGSMIVNLLAESGSSDNSFIPHIKLSPHAKKKKKKKKEKGKGTAGGFWRYIYSVLNE